MTSVISRGPFSPVVQRDDQLYELYGEPLEATHWGQFVAISLQGEIIIGPNDLEVLQQALARFGRGNFAFRRIGGWPLGKWRKTDNKLKLSCRGELTADCGSGLSRLAACDQTAHPLIRYAVGIR